MKRWTIHEIYVACGLREGMKTQCTNCGVTSKNQPEGDGCHACHSGVMVKAE